MPLIKSFLTIALMLLFHHAVNSQEYHDRDSLWNELKNAKMDSNKVWLYIRLGQQYENNDPDSSLILYESALNLSESLGYTRGIIAYYTNATYVYNLKGMYDTALMLNLRSVEIARAFGDHERLTACLGNVGTSYTVLDQQEKAIEIYLQIIPLLEKLPRNSNQGVIYQNLAMLYNDIGQPAKAIDYGKMALQNYSELANEYGMASALINLSIAYSDFSQYDSALRLLEKATVLAKKTNNQYALMTTLLNVSNVNIARGNFDLIKDYCTEALALANKLDDPVSQAVALRGLAIYYLNHDMPRQARHYAEQSLRLALDSHSLRHAGKAYNTLSSIALLERDFRLSNRYGMKSDSIRNVLLNESVAKNVKTLEAKYESEKKEQRIRTLQQEAQIKDLSIERSKLFNAALIGSMAFLVMLVFLVRYNYQQKKKLLIKENQVQEARISQLENEKQILAGEAVIKGQEEERGRLAKDLHDGLGGMLSGVKFSLTNMRSNVVLDADNMLVFERSLDMLDHSISELRRVAHNMMPEVLVRFGLSEALKSYCESLRNSDMFNINYQAIGLVDRLPDKTEIFIFRIVQELLTNVAKHAQASEVLVQLAQDNNEVSITVEDDGAGFNPEEKQNSGAGLTSVRSRVEYLKGKLDIQSRAGSGTSVYITIPLA